MNKHHSNRPSMAMVATSVAVVGLLVASGITFFYSSRYVTTAVISDDVKKLAAIFQKIDETCGIMDFDAPKSTINFLNVKSFVGSEVGSVNLRYPDKWEGPYLSDNLTVQGTEYMIVRTKKGAFVVPGDGVKLPNRMVMGKDIVLDENSDIQAMMNDPQSLMHNGQPLAAKIGGTIAPSGDIAMEVDAMDGE